jgi:hypothetical protein
MFLSKQLLFSLLLIISFSYQMHAQQKRALIIAVGDYDKDVTGWNEISSANDVPLIKGALLAQGFKQESISILQDEEATAAGILSALDALENKVENGDVIVIHYSGHGQQITDDNGDEIDGYDEAMVPIDAHMRFRDGVYEGQNHIRDDVIGERLMRIRKKAGPKGSVLLIMDSCHSGTASRGLAKARGTQEVFSTSNSQPKEGERVDDSFGLQAETPDPDLASLICIYGASAHELNYETKDANGNGVGSLSLAFSDAFANARNSESYEELFDQVKNKMAAIAPRQTPQAEGDLNRMVLGGKIEGKKTYFKVTKIWEDATVSIDGGTLMGIYEGSEISFYPLGKEAVQDNLLAKGKVSYVDATSADVVLSPNDTQALKNAKAVVTQVNYGKIQVSVKVSVADEALKKALLNSFDQYPLIKVVEEEGELLIEDKSNSRGAGVSLITTQEYMLLDLDAAPADENALALTKNVLAYAQANFLRQVAMQNEDLEVRFEFIPIKATQVGRGRWKESERLEISQKKDASGNIQFNGGDFFKLKLINNGFEVAYITLLDFQPNNVINVLVPGKYKQAADYVIKPGEEIELPDVFRFGPPYGTEVFKLVATKQPIDFRKILVAKGNTRGGNEENNPFAQLVASSFKEDSGTRGSETMNVAPGSCNIYSVSFSITPAD